MFDDLFDLEVEFHSQSDIYSQIKTCISFKCLKFPVAVHMLHDFAKMRMF